MDKDRITIVDLPPMRVASAHGFGQTPELIALQKLYAFAQSNGLLVGGTLPPTYGFNNPGPTPGSPNYGYEAWLPVSEHVQARGDIRLLDFAGGKYAVMRCHGIENIGTDWLQLATWRETTRYLAGKHQWLEELLTPVDTPPDQMELDLHLPIAE